MASMAAAAAAFASTPSAARRRGRLSPRLSPSTHLSPPHALCVPRRSADGGGGGGGGRRPSGLRVRSGLIEPDGGRLSELVVGEPLRRARARESLALPRVKLSRIDLEWVHVLSEGWASPLRGFMRESEFLQTLHFNALRLADGSVVNMSVPIVLAVDDADRHRIGESSKVALFDADDNPVAILSE